MRKKVINVFFFFLLLTGCATLPGGKSAFTGPKNLEGHFILEWNDEAGTPSIQYVRISRKDNGYLLTVENPDLSKGEYPLSENSDGSVSGVGRDGNGDAIVYSFLRLKSGYRLNIVQTNTQNGSPVEKWNAYIKPFDSNYKDIRDRIRSRYIWPLSGDEKSVTVSEISEFYIENREELLHLLEYSPFSEEKRNITERYRAFTITLPATIEKWETLDDLSDLPHVLKYTGLVEDVVALQVLCKGNGVDLSCQIFMDKSDAAPYSPGETVDIEIVIHDISGFMNYSDDFILDLTGSLVTR